MPLPSLSPPTPGALSPLSPVVSVLSSIQPPHPIPGRAVRDTSPHPAHEDSPPLDREQPVAGILDASQSEECLQSEGCDRDSPPTADSLTDDLSLEKTAAAQPANPLLPDYPTLLLKNLYPKPPSRGDPPSKSAEAAPSQRRDSTETPGSLDEVFGGGEGPTLSTGGEREVPADKMDRAGDGGGPQCIRLSTVSQQSTVESPLVPLSPGLPKFLHLRVSCEGELSFTPMVRGVSIPGQHFKDDVWFAIPDDR